MQFYAKGRRSVVYTTTLNGRKVAVKVYKNKSQLDNEAKWLRVLNRQGIGPRLIKRTKDSILYHFVEGERILDWIASHDKDKITDILRQTLEQCRKLDRLKVNKEELHNPYKHILVSKHPTMIDFERCHRTERPKNVTQFCQFLMSGKVTILLKRKGIVIKSKEIIPKLRHYKEKQTEMAFGELLRKLF